MQNKNLKNKKLYLGNLYVKRDWGHAREYVEVYVVNVKTKKPEDFVISTGQQINIKQFVNIVLKRVEN